MISLINLSSHRILKGKAFLYIPIIINLIKLQKNNINYRL